MNISKTRPAVLLGFLIVDDRLRVGDNAPNFELRVWAASQVQTPATLKSELYFSIFSVFKAAGGFAQKANLTTDERWDG